MADLVKVADYVAAKATLKGGKTGDVETIAARIKAEREARERFVSARSSVLSSLNEYNSRANEHGLMVLSIQNNEASLKSESTDPAHPASFELWVDGDSVKCSRSTRSMKLADMEVSGTNFEPFLFEFLRDA